MHFIDRSPLLLSYTYPETTFHTTQPLHRLFMDKIYLFPSHVMLAWTLSTIAAHFLHMSGAYVNSDWIKPRRALLPPFPFVRPTWNMQPTAACIWHGFRQSSSSFDLFQPFHLLVLFVIAVNTAQRAQNHGRPRCSAEEWDPAGGPCPLLLAILWRAAGEVQWTHRFHSGEHGWFVFSSDDLSFLGYSPTYSLYSNGHWQWILYRPHRVDTFGIRNEAWAETRVCLRFHREIVSSSSP